MHFLEKRLKIYHSTGEIFIRNLLRTALPCSLNRIPRKTRGKYFSIYCIDFYLNSVVTFLPISDFRNSCRQVRRSWPEVFCKKVFFLNFAKFTGKQLCRSIFLNKVAGLRPAASETTEKAFFFDKVTGFFKRFLTNILRLFFGNFTKFFEKAFVEDSRAAASKINSRKRR